MISLKFMMRFDSCERTEGNQLKVQHSECKEIHSRKEAKPNRNYLANANHDDAETAADKPRNKHNRYKPRNQGIIYNIH